ncbi:MAG: GNAT family N-acetyltransferase [Pseudomonadota bacterium]
MPDLRTVAALIRGLALGVINGGEMGTGNVENQRAGYRLSTLAGDMDVGAIHAYLTGSYWAQGISRAVVAKAISGSLCFGVFDGAGQVGFARVVTDRATFAYLCDVYVLEGHRGRGLATWLMEAVVAHPELQGLRRFMLATRDAHGLYEKFGFAPLARPEIFMTIHRPEIYLAQPQKQ